MYTRNNKKKKEGKQANKTHESRTNRLENVLRLWWSVIKADKYFFPKFHIAAQRSDYIYLYMYIYLCILMYIFLYISGNEKTKIGAEQRDETRSANCNTNQIKLFWPTISCNEDDYDDRMVWVCQIKWPKVWGRGQFIRSPKKKKKTRRRYRSETKGTYRNCSALSTKFRIKRSGDFFFI